MIDDTALPVPPLSLDLPRLLAELLSGMAVAGIGAFDGELDRSIIFAVVARRSEALLPPGAPAAPDDRAHAITINALAASLSRPFETIRRHVNTMLDAGLVTRTPRGVVVPIETFSDPKIARLLTTQHDLLVRLIQDMASAGIALPAPHPGIRYNRRAGIASALDALLTLVEFGASHYGCWLEMVIFAVVVCANDPAAAHDTPMPVSPAPVSIVTIARALDLPYSTVRRHAEAMAHDGALVRRRGGLVATQAWLARPALTEGGRTLADHIRRILARLAAFGFPFDDPASAYAENRPVLEWGNDARPVDGPMTKIAAGGIR